jgi:hypothetical protein
VPAKSKQQQKFFGVVKAMQSGNVPKKGAAGKAAKEMSKKEVDKYASTKHKGLPMKVKGETVIYRNKRLGLEIVEFNTPFSIQEAEYQGRKVKLGQVTRTSGDKKFQVYVKNPKTDNIKKLKFGDGTGLSIKTKDPARRKSFKARHNCDNPGPKDKARYWSCRMWAGPDSVKNMLKKKK